MEETSLECYASFHVFTLSKLRSFSLQGYLESLAKKQNKTHLFWHGTYFNTYGSSPLLLIIPRNIAHFFSSVLF